MSGRSSKFWSNGPVGLMLLQSGKISKLFASDSHQHPLGDKWVHYKGGCYHRRQGQRYIDSHWASPLLSAQGLQRACVRPGMESARVRDVSELCVLLLASYSLRLQVAKQRKASACMRKTEKTFSMNESVLRPPLLSYSWTSHPQF